MKKRSYKCIEFADKIGGKNGGTCRKGKKAETKKLLQNSYYYLKTIYIK